MNRTGPSDAPLAIIGIGCLFPGSKDAAGYWASIRDGRDSITAIPKTHWRPEDYLDSDPKSRDRVYVARGGFLEEIDFRPLEFGITPSSMEATDTAQLLALVAAKNALDDAGYGAGREFDRRRVGVILGVTGALELVIPLGARLGHPLWRRALEEAGVNERTAEDVISRIADGYVDWQEASFPGLLGNVVAGRIANRLDLWGTNCVVDAACASSLSALHLASMELSSGRADLVVTGGVDTFNDIFMYMCFSKTPALSPTGDARPFDQSADGTILGEGIGIVVLKRLADAEADGDRIYAVIRGIGTSSDGKGNAIYAPTKAGQVRCLENAYQSAKVSPATVELIEGHGTGTKVGDLTELAALTEVFGTARPEESWCALGSVKSQIGHTKAAAGAAGLIKAALALHHKVLPPTLKVRAPLDVGADRSPFYLNTSPRPWVARPDHPRRAGVSSFGFGGSNFHVVLEEATPTKKEVDWPADVEILALGGDSAADVAEQIRGLKTADRADWERFVDAAARSRERFDVAAPYRMVAVIERGAGQWTEALSRLAHSVATAFPDVFSSTGDVFLGRGGSPGKLAMLFPGQGAQATGMLRDLACRFPAMLQALDLANEASGRSERLSDWIYPPPAYSADARRAQDERLRATEVAQPALAAVCLGALEVLREFGIEPQMAAGHSFGEVVALSAARVLSPADAIRVAVLRGRLMADLSTGNGGMLAILAQIARVNEILARCPGDLVLANKNGPEQYVLSGPIASIEAAERACREEGIRAVRLPVGGAFHSPLVSGASPALRAGLGGMALHSPTFPVYSNTTAGPYPPEPDAIRDLLARQLAQPVEWARQIEAMAADGARVFVEVGPGGRLGSLVREILGERAIALSLENANGSDSSVGLPRLLAALAALGFPVALERFKPRSGRSIDRSSSSSGAGEFSIRLSGANYRNQKAKAPPKSTEPTPRARPADRPAPPPVSADHPEQRPAEMPQIPREPRKEHRVNEVASEYDDRPNALAPRRVPAPSTANDPGQAFQFAKESIAALLELQRQTGDIHRQFLEAQESAGRTLAALVEMQQRLVTGGVPDGLVGPSRSERAIEPARPRATPSQPANAPGRPLAPPLPPAPVDVAKPLPAAIPQRVASDAAEPSRPAVDDAPRSSMIPALLEVVAEKTGYPAEMLRLEMELDADLGIDSIKRVEILSAMQDRWPQLPAVKSEQLGALRTLGSVVDLLSSPGGSEGRRPGGSSPNVRVEAPLEPSARSSTALGPQAAVLSEQVLAIVAEKTGYPAEMLRLEMELDADLGIDSIKRVEILSAVQESIPGVPAARSEDLGRLRTLGSILELLAGSAARATEERAPPAQAERQGSAPVPSANPPSDGGTKTDTDRSVSRLVPRLAPFSLRDERPTIHPPEGALVAIAEDGSPFAGALAAAFRDRGYRTVVAPIADLDFAVESLAGLLIVAPAAGTTQEFLEQSLLAVQRAASALKQSASDGGAFLLTVSRLGGSFGLRRTSIGDPLSGALAGLAKTAAREWPAVNAKAIDLPLEMDVDRVARMVMDEAFLSGPVEVALAGDRLETILLEEDSASTGSDFSFEPGEVVLVTGGARGVTAEVVALLAQSRPTIILLGRSSLPEPDDFPDAPDLPELSRRLATLRPGDTPRTIREAAEAILSQRFMAANLARFEQAGASVHYHSIDVRDRVKLAALVREIRAAHGPIRGLIHGAGVLADRRIEDKTVGQFRAVWETKVTSLEVLLDVLADEPLRWIGMFSSSTARFGRVGQVDYAMANEALNKLAGREACRRPDCRVVSINWGPWAGGMVDPALARLFAEEGVGLIPLEAGARFFLAEWSRPADAPVEVVALVDSSEAAPAVDPSFETAFTRQVDIETHPFLASHVMNGRAVLPLAMVIEWMAEAALHFHPGLFLHGIDDVVVYKGVVLSPGEAERVRFDCAKAQAAAGEFSILVELRGADETHSRTHHARGVVRLATSPPGLMNARLEAREGGGIAPCDVYERLLFHGEHFQGLRTVDAVWSDGIAGTALKAAPPARFLEHPLRNAWLIDPVIMDVAFQLIILWSIDQLGTPALPCFVGRYRQWVRAFPAGPVTLVAKIVEHVHQRITAEIEIQREGSLLARLERVDCIVDGGLAGAFRKNRLPREAVS